MSEKFLFSTTLEQSEQLVKCGLDPDTADGHYWQGPSWFQSTYVADVTSFHTPYARAVENLRLMSPEGDFLSHVCKPIWSVSKLISLMPKRISHDGSFFDLNIEWVDAKHTGMEDAEMKPVLNYSQYGKIWLCITDPVRRLEKPQSERYRTDGCNTLVECAVTMICWLLEAGYMEKHKLQTSSAENIDQTEYFHQPEDTKEDEDD